MGALGVDSNSVTTVHTLDGADKRVFVKGIAGLSSSGDQTAMTYKDSKA